MGLTKHEADTLIQAIKGFVVDKPELFAKSSPLAPLAEERHNGSGSSGPGRVSLNVDEIEKLYQVFKRRFIEEARTDHILLHLITLRPEIVIELEPKLVELDGSTLRGRVARLMAAGWMTTARAPSAVRRELARTGADPGGGGSLSECLSGFVRDGFLTRAGGDYVLAPEVKITERSLERS